MVDLKFSFEMMGQARREEKPEEEKKKGETENCARFN